MKDINLDKNRFLIVSIVPHDLYEDEVFENVSELISLVESFGGTVVDIVLQSREVHEKGKYIGKGKVQEINAMLSEEQIDIIVLNANIVPSQIYDLTTLFAQTQPNIEVWDRSDLILKIFAQRAQTSEAKLQIELAAMRHMGPRIFGMGMEMSRQGGGIGTRGIGETNTEIMKRHWREEMKATNDKLKKLAHTRHDQITRRQQRGIKTVSLVGYTNVGKTSLFNALTSKKKLAQDILFATLESYSSKLYLHELKQEIILTDTIGFIRDLPPQLIDAFTSTLMESIYSDLLLHVIDMSDKDMFRKIEVVTETLRTLKITDKPIVYVFNKTDLPSHFSEEELTDRFSEVNPLFISVTKKKGLEKVIEAISKRLS